MDRGNLTDLAIVQILNR